MGAGKGDSHICSEFLKLGTIDHCEFFAIATTHRGWIRSDVRDWLGKKIRRESRTENLEYGVTLMRSPKGLA
jgi:hypothetical protein